MPIVHYLNVKEGDCSIIEHGSGHISVIDVCNARDPDQLEAKLAKAIAVLAEKAAGSGNHNQKAYPENPIEYMRASGYRDVFRFILTGPDMDHMDGIKDFFTAFPPTNFWDTANVKEIGSGAWNGSSYREEDWKYYKKLRDSDPQSDPRRLVLYSGARGKYYSENEEGKPAGDAMYVLAPTPELVDAANEEGQWNDASYVILYRGAKGRVLFSGDSHNDTWEYLLANHEKDIADMDLLIAPHHGRKSGRSYKFLDVVKPKVTFFGNAPSQHLAYNAWSSRGLPYITNNQAGSMVVDAGVAGMPVYVTNDAFAKQRNPLSTYSVTYRGWFLQNIK